jgi:phosphonate degradation associated HDIG domain protein
MTPEPIATLQDLFARFGHLAYGELVTQEQHALQCATLAAESGATPELITAAFLHDVGHLLHQDAAAAYAHGVDDRHEAFGAAWLARWFGPTVVKPVELHVAAKRYLCATEPSYARELSVVSKRTLALQGGPMRGAEATMFVSQPHASAALRLRRWDEGGKRQGASALAIDQVWRIVADCLTKATAAADSAVAGD